MYVYVFVGVSFVVLFETDLVIYLKRAWIICS